MLQIYLPKAFNIKPMGRGETLTYLTTTVGIAKGQLKTANPSTLWPLSGPKEATLNQHQTNLLNFLITITMGQEEILMSQLALEASLNKVSPIEASLSKAYADILKTSCRSIPSMLCRGLGMPMPKWRSSNQYREWVSSSWIEGCVSPNTSLPSSQKQRCFKINRCLGRKTSNSSSANLLKYYLLTIILSLKG